jgi:catechol 2,3-dioxygenase-like lactoylglutathione lyase family enzyme
VSERFRLGLRVPDVPAAVAFYGGLGFDEKAATQDAWFGG